MTQGKSRPWPVELRLNPAKSQLTVEYDTGERFVLPAEYLRVESPSADRKSEPGLAADQLLFFPVERQWPLGHRADQDFEQLGIGVHRLNCHRVS